MRAAGIDFGGSNIKAIWRGKDGYLSAITDYYSLDELKGILAEDSVDRCHLAGIRSPQYAREEPWSRAGIILPGDPIEHEIQLQARGVKGLLPQSMDSFLLVSVGTATSYTVVGKESAEWYQPGSALGGGFLTNIGDWLGLNHRQFRKEAAKGKPLDLLFKDRLPETANSPFGDYVIASFGKANFKASLADICASFISLTAVGIVSHVLDVQQNPNYGPFGTVVYIGTPVKKNHVLRQMLKNGTTMIGLKSKFPRHGEYALALGALISEEFSHHK